MASMDYENENGTRYEDEAPRYDRDRSASPRPNRRNESPRGGGRRSASPNGNSRGNDRGASKSDREPVDEPDAINTGSNLFVTGIHPRLTEADVTLLFEKYGEVEKCQIMLDPHTKESRGFGFVKMVTAEQADAAKEGLQGEEHEGRTLAIEKARRSRPRTPTPGKYFGPPKREDPRGPPPGRYGDRYDDRRRGGYGGGGYGGGYGGGGGYYGGGGGGGYRSDYRDDYRRDDRDRGYRGRDDRERDGGYGSRGGSDRYGGGGGRDDRYSNRGGGGGYDRYDRGGRDDRPPRDGPASSGYGDPASRGAREPYGGRGDGDDRHGRGY